MGPEEAVMGESIRRWLCAVLVGLTSGGLAAGAVVWIGLRLADRATSGEAGMGTVFVFAYVIAPMIGLTVAIALGLVVGKRL
jgi:hypothetical protein